MNRQEIEEMMRDLPSQQDYYEETILQKCIISFLFIAFLIALCCI
jgi:hypothetical protein